MSIIIKKYKYIYCILVEFHYHLSSLISIWYRQIALSLDNIVAVAIGLNFSPAYQGEGKSTVVISEKGPRTSVHSHASRPWP